MRNSREYLLLVSLVLLTVLSATDVSAQNVIEVRRDQLTLLPNTGDANRVEWSLTSSGTRRENVRCTIENGSRFRNENAHIVFRLTDNGGLLNDPACDFNMRFPNLQNSFVFESVATEEPVHCGNPPCTTEIIRNGDGGDPAFDVLIRLNMKGIVSWLPSTTNKRMAAVQVRLKLSSPANRTNFNPFRRAFIPNLFVSRIRPALSLQDRGCKVGVTLVNTGEAAWNLSQGHAYDSLNEVRAVRITLRRNGQQCGAAEVSLREFDPVLGLTRSGSPVTLVWPGCSFFPGPPDTFTVTVDSENQLVEESETNKTKTVEQSCLPLPPRSPRRR